MARPHLPRRLDELELSWLREVMGSTTASLQVLECERIGEGEGMMGEIGRLHLSPGPPHSAIAKFPTRHRGNRSQGQFLGIYQREARFYADLADSVGYAVPRCLGVRFTPEAAPDPGIGDVLERMPSWLLRALVALGMFLSGWVDRRSVLLLEDLAPAEPGDQLAGLAPGRLEAVVRATARAHAASWNDPRLTEREWLPPVDAAPALLRVFHRRAQNLFRRAPGGPVPIAVLTLAAEVNEQISPLCRALAGPPWTLLHGDLRADNLFFRADGPEGIVFTDWQVPQRGRGALDLAYFLAGTLDPSATREQEEGLVQLYAEELVRGGVRDYDAAECLLDYRRGLLQTLPRVLTASATIDMTNERGTAMQHRWLERLVARIETLPHASWREILRDVSG